MYASSSLLANSTTTLASAAPAVVIGATSVSTDAGTALTLSVPAGAGVGDLFFIVTSLRGTTTTIAGPAGWTGHTQYSQGTTISQRAHHNFASSSDLTTTHTVTFGATPVKAAAVLLVVRGVQSNPFLTSAGLANASATSIAVPGLTMAAQSVLLLIGASKAHSDPHSQASGFALDPSATVASGPSGATAHRLSVHTRSSAIADPPATTIAAGAVAAVSVGVQMAVALGPTVGEQIVASPAALVVTGVAAALPPYLVTGAPGSYATTGAAMVDVYTATWSTLVTLGPTAASYSDITCAPSTTYTYRVVAVNPVGASTSNEASATTLPLGASFTMTAVPGALGLTGATSGATLATERLVASGDIYGLGGVSATLANPPLVYEVIDTVDGLTHTYSDIGLEPSTWYAYRVVAVNTAAEVASNVAVAQTLAATSTNFPLVASPGVGALSGASLGALAIRAPMLAGNVTLTGRLTTETVVHQIAALATSYTTTPAAAGATLPAATFLSALRGTYAQTGIAASIARVFVGQQAVPVADISDGGWLPSVGVDLYPTIDEATDEAPVDSDYIRTVNPIADTAVVDLTDLQPPLAGDVLILVRTRQV